MSVTRGEFLRSLGKSLPGMVLGSGAVAVHKLVGKIAAVGGEPEAPVMKPLPEARTYPKPPELEIIQCGPAARNQVALTFDDGPTPGVTERILDEFKQRGLHTTFFMIGQRIAATPDLARRVVAEGHEVGNQTFTHPKLTELPPARVEEEIQKTQDIILEVLGLQAAWFRAPYLAFRRDLAPCLIDRGMKLVEGNVDPSDWSQPGEEQILATITRETKAGSIVICHDVHAQTANVIGTVLDQLTARGLTPVTMSALLAE